MFRQKADFASLESENILLEVDASLVGFQYVEPEEEVFVVSLRDYFQFLGVLGQKGGKDTHLHDGKRTCKA